MDDKVLNRLKRIQGQVEGVIKMYEDCRECGDVVMQIAAVRSALAGVGKELLKEEAVECLKTKNHNDLDKILKQLFEIS